MSVRLMTFVWDHAPVKGTKLNVLLILADHANDGGRCWPSVARIAHRARMSERQTRRILRELEDDGLLRAEQRNAQPSLYTILLEGRTSTSGRTFSVDTPDISVDTPDIAVSAEPPIEPLRRNKDEDKELKKESRPTASQLEREAIDRVWSYYLEVIPSKKQLDEKRKRVIANALRTTRAVQECTAEEAEARVKRAVLGLSRSPWHNGANPDATIFLEIRYALKGKGDESDDERIEKAISWAAIYAPDVASVDNGKIERWIDEVRYHLGKLAIDSQATAGRDRAKEAYRKLTQAGFKVERLEHRPYARVTR